MDEKNLEERVGKTHIRKKSPEDKDALRNKGCHSLD